MSSLVDALASLALPALVGAALPRLKPETFDAERTPRMLATLVTEVTLPALSLAVLAGRPLPLGAALAVIPAVFALAAGLLLARGVAKALALDGPATGTLMLTSCFSNTAFVGLPMTQAILPGRDPLTAALLVDTVATTLGLWTVGIAVAQRFGGRSSRRSLATVFLRPATLSVLVGLLISGAGLRLPGWTLRALEPLGAATTPLAFMFLGMRIDLRGAWQARAPIAAISGIKLLALPLLALLGARALRVPAEATAVGVLQSAMPTAIVAAVIAEETGCDARLAAGAVAATLALGITVIAASGPLFRALAG